MNRKIGLIGILLLLLAVTGVSVTLAWLVGRSQSVTNTFTAGNIEITLTESTGSSYKMVPALTVKKDPVVTVKGGSDACWLFVITQKSKEFDSYVTYEIADGWTALGDVDGVYYRQVEKGEEDTSFIVLKNNAITVKETVTEEKLAALTENPTLEFAAYAIQLGGNDSAQTAWNNIKVEE